MRQPFDAISERASELLLDRIREKAAGESARMRHSILLPCTLIVRESCRPLSRARLES